MTSPETNINPDNDAALYSKFVTRCRELCRDLNLNRDMIEAAAMDIFQSLMRKSDIDVIDDLNLWRYLFCVTAWEIEDTKIDARQQRTRAMTLLRQRDEFMAARDGLEAAILERDDALRERDEAREQLATIGRKAFWAAKSKQRA